MKTTLLFSIIIIIFGGSVVAQNPVKIEAEDYAYATPGIGKAGISAKGGGTCIGWIKDGAYVEYNNVMLYGKDTWIAARFSSILQGNGKIEVHIDSPNNEPVGYISIYSTAGWDNYMVLNKPMDQMPQGPATVYLVFRGSDSYFVNLDYFIVSNRKLTYPEEMDLNFGRNRIYADSYASATGQIAKADNGAPENGTCIGWITKGSWAYYPNVRMDNAWIFEARVSSATNGGQLAVRTSSPEGNTIAVITIPNTGGWEYFRTISIGLPYLMSGTHDIYLYFWGEDDGYLFNVAWFQFVPK
jgi:hypothetical protein